MDRLEHYRTFRDYLKHEDGLINNRLSWNITIQSFLFATYGLCLQKLLETSGKMYENVCQANLPCDWKQVDAHLHMLGGHAALNFMASYVVPSVGLLVAVLAWAGTKAAVRAIDKLDEDWNQIDMDRAESSMQVLPRLTNGGANRRWLLSFAGAPHFVPGLFVMAWIVIILNQIRLFQSHLA